MRNRGLTDFIFLDLNRSSEGLFVKECKAVRK